MKKLTCFFGLWVLLAFAVSAQVGINTDGSQPDPSAILDAKSSTKGFLPPRMTTTQRDAIVFPARGLVVYNLDCDDLQIFNGATWIPLGNSGNVAAPLTISGLTTPCMNAVGVTYSIAPIPGAVGYTWTAPIGSIITAGQGTTTITVSFGNTDGAIFVSAYGTCWKSLGAYLGIQLQPLPATPVEGVHVPLQIQITWNWNAVQGATGYKFNTVNDYSTAEDLGAVTTKTETGLTCNATFSRYVWAYNACVGLPVTLTQTTLACMNIPCPNTPTVTYGGKTYNTVLIGSQCWFAENLNIGTKINGSLLQTNNGIIEKFCYADADANCSSFGGLYQWDEMMNYSTMEGAQGICPSGWHIPTDAEVCTLTQFLDPTVNCNVINVVSGINAGGKMKETGFTHWGSPNTGATNESGFSAFGGGHRTINMNFSSIPNSGLYWTSTSTQTSNAFNRNIYYDRADIGRGISAQINGFSVRCIQGVGVTSTASVTTTNATNVTQSTATSGGNVTNDGGANVTARGVCWSTSQNPTISGSHTTDGTGMGTFTSTISGLTINTTYYIRAYATNSVGTAYGNQVTCTTIASTGQPCPNIPAVVYEGKTYNTVQIGTQCWLKENLNVGTRINGSLNQTNNQIIEKYCYDDIESNCDVYGGLYQWDEAMQYLTSQGVQGLCPNGWHFPTDDEWKTLEGAVDSQYGVGNPIWNTTGTRGYDVGKNLKSLSGFNYGNGTNLFGFTALPNGQRATTQVFMGIGVQAHFWSSTQNSTLAWRRIISGDYDGTDRDDLYKDSGRGVRCLQNTSTATTTASVTTTPASNITQTTATSGGNVTSDGGAAVTSRGVCWSTSQNPIISGSHTTDGTGVGTFTSTISGLTSNTTYYIRAYATNSVGTAYGNQVTCTTLSNLGQPCPNVPTIIYEGITYNTVQIGTQCWLKENLNVGTRIIGSQEQTNNGIIEKYCYNDLESNCDVYGGLYQWNEAMQFTNTAGVQGICPQGWHVPTDAEWTQLSIYLGGENVAGGKMKETGTTHWLSPNLGATNSSGFTGLPNGSRKYDMSFNYLTTNATFWSSSWYTTEMAWDYWLDYINEDFDRGYYTKVTGFSVRCLKDSESSTTTPTVSTTSVSNISQTSAQSGGNVTSDGGATVTARGVCWSTSPNPTVSDNHTTDGGGTGTFVSAISGLSPNTPYYVRAYATNSFGTAYGNQVTCATLSNMGQPCPNVPTIIYEGKTYNTVQIGTQCWLKENLNVGTRIIGSQEQTNNGIIEKYCYNDLESNCDVYGGLYQWNEMMQYLSTQGTRGICPDGWHIPSEGDVATLTTYLGGVTIAGGKMKEAGTAHWNAPNLGATNESGFTTLPAGWRNISGNYYERGIQAFIWSSKNASSDYSYSYNNFYNATSNHFETKMLKFGFSVRCIQGAGVTGTASVTTTAASNITQTTATSGGNVTSDGGATVTARGVCWSTSPNPTVTDNYSTDGGGTGTYVSAISGLSPNTPYYVRAYATNNVGTAYGNQVTFSTLPPFVCGTSSIIDSRDGKTYNTVLIGTQCWLKENLNIGTRINGSQNQTNNQVIEKYCYNDLESNCDVYGGMYQWGEMVQYLNGASNTTSWNPVPTGNIQGICPIGWHIPTDAEWTQLTTFLGGEAVAGGPLKEAGYVHWQYPNTGATNSSGFTMLPAGENINVGTFVDYLIQANYWCATEETSTRAYHRNIYYNVVNVGRGTSPKIFSATSVRCLKD